MKTRAKKTDKKIKIQKSDRSIKKGRQIKQKDIKKDAQQNEQAGHALQQEQTINAKDKKSLEKQQNKSASMNQSKSQQKSKDKYVDLMLTEDQYLMLMHYLPKGYSLQSFQSLKKTKHPSLVNFPQHTKKIERQIKTIKKIEKQLDGSHKQQKPIETKNALVTRSRNRTNTSTSITPLADWPKQHGMLERKSQRIFSKEKKASYAQPLQNEDVPSQTLPYKNDEMNEKYVQLIPHNKKMQVSQLKLAEIGEQRENPIDESHIIIKPNNEVRSIEIETHRQTQSKNEEKQLIKQIAKQQEDKHVPLPLPQSQQQSQSCKRQSQKQLQSQSLKQKSSDHEHVDLKQTRGMCKSKCKLRKSKRIDKQKRKLIIQSSSQDIKVQTKQEIAEQSQLKQRKTKDNTAKNKRKNKPQPPSVPPSDKFYNQWNILYKLKRHSYSQPFLQPVDEALDGAKNYYKRIKHPMDLSTIENKLQSKQYKQTNEFHLDVDLMLSNSLIFNKTGLMKSITLDLQHYYKSLMPQPTLLQIKKQQKTKRKSLKP